MVDWLHWYHRLPYSLRVVAASAKGVQIQRLRYGQETDRLVQEARDRESWGADKWRVWQEECLSQLLHRAVNRVPYYREYWKTRQAKGDRSSWEDLANWPILRKETVRADPLRFLADDRKAKRLHRAHTSGSTGQPLCVWQSRSTIRRWYALFEARWRIWNGVSRRDRWANLAGKQVVAFEQERPPFWVWNFGMRQLYLSCYHLKPANIPYYLDAMAQHGVVYLYGLASSMNTVAQEALRRGGGPHLKAVISSAEPLYPHHREALSQAFGCRVVDTYGMTEMVTGASECTAGRLHLWPDAGFVEIWDEEAECPTPAGRCGAIVATGLINSDMPLIRYATSDWGSVAPGVSQCACGCELPVLQSIEGRVDDLILTPDGRKVMVIWSFLSDLPIKETQVVQESLEQITVNFVPAGSFADSHADTMVERLRKRIGPFEIRLQKMEAIPRRANGKFRAVISRLTSSNPGH